MRDKALVLAIDDEPSILKLVSQVLSDDGYRVVTATGGSVALDVAEEYRPDLILLDLTLPDLDGLEVMRHLRERVNVPIIMVTGRGTDIDKVTGLQLGADDYLAKPFNPKELSARVEAVLRRSHGAPRAAAIVSTAGDIQIDLARRAVLKGGEMIRLSRTEWLVLQALAANAGKVMLHNELLSKVWGPEYRDELDYLRVWVSRLRHKLEPDPAEPVIIKTMQGIGYLLNAEPASAGVAARDPD